MSFHITLQPSGHEYDVEEGSTILQAALDAGIKLPYGCKNGACGACKGKVIAGQVDHAAAPEGTLPLDQRADGMALFCCAKPMSDMVIEAREVVAGKDIPVKTLPCRVQKLERLAPDVIALQLKLPTNERLQFLAGQYIEILMKDGKRRAFSLANAPQEDELLQLHIRLIDGGHFTSQVFGAMKEREMLRFEGPYGSFFLREDEASAKKPVSLMAGGTGFAPLKSIVEYALHSKLERPLHIYWGARDRAGLYLDALPRRWVAEHAHVHYTPVLSEPATGDDWQGRTGLVHQAVLADHADLANFQVYACGAPAMVEVAHRDFVAQGLPEDEFYSDAFTFAKDASPKS
jgi:CDP-4-dehydro-6-deoxyglucose reductase